MEYQRRYSDRFGRERDASTRNEGIENRLYFAPPGEIISLRTGTEELCFDYCQNETWGDVMRVLCEKGSFQKLGDGEYKKMGEAFSAKIAGEPKMEESSLYKVMKTNRAEEERKLNLNREEDLYNFIRMRLMELARETVGDIRIEMLSRELTELIRKNWPLPEAGPKLRYLESPLRTIEQKIERLIDAFCTRENLDKLVGLRPSIVDKGIKRRWTQSIMDVYLHQSSHRQEV